MGETKMNDTKPWYASTGVWGGIIAVLTPLIGAFFHMTVSSADSAALADALAGIGTAIGGILAVYGRVTATTQIGAPK